MDTILVATDLSPRSDRAILRAAHLAKTTGAALHVVHVIDDDVPAAILQSRTQEAEKALTDMVADSVLLTEAAPRIDVEAGHVDRLLLDLCQARSASLVVVGGHRNRGFGELLGAPTLARLLRGLDVPVLVAVGRPEEDYTKVAVGWDFSPASHAAVTAAKAVAPDAAMTLVHAWQEPCTGAPYAFETGGTIPQGTLDTLRADILRAAAKVTDGGPPVGADVAIGPPGHVLRHMAQRGEADLLSLGRHARTGLVRFLLGATAEDVALNAGCDVLISPVE